MKNNSICLEIESLKEYFSLLRENAHNDGHQNAEQVYELASSILCRHELLFEDDLETIKPLLLDYLKILELNYKLAYSPEEIAAWGVVIAITKRHILASANLTTAVI